MRPPHRLEIGGRPGTAGDIAHAPPPQEPAHTTLGDWYLLGLLVLGAFSIILLGIQSNVYDLDRYAFPKAVALHAVALLALLVLAPRTKRLELGLVDALLVGYVLWSAASVVLARNWWLALSSFGLTFSGVIVYFAARAVGRSRGPTLVAWLALAAALGSGLGVGQAYGANWSFLGTTRPPGGTFGNRNFLAHLTAIAVPLLLLVRLRARRGSLAFLSALALGVAAAAIVLTRSRAAWLGLAAALAIMLVTTLVGWRAIRSEAGARGRLRGAVLALAIGAAAAVALPNGLDWRSSNPYAETLTRITDYRGGSGKGRLVQYRNSVKMLKFDPVFGVGPGNWFVHYPRVTTPGDRAFDPGDPIPTNPWPSSDWVTFLVERGPIGVLLLLSAFFAATVACLKAARVGDRNRALGAVALLGSLAAAVVCGLFDAVLLLPAPTFFVFAILGALLPRPPRLVVDRRLSGGTRALATIGMIVVAAGITALAAGQLRALVLTQESTSRRVVEDALTWDPGDYRLNLLMMNRGSCSSRARYARTAAALLPYHAAPKRALRECGIRVH